MAILEGRGAWINNYAPEPDVHRAKDAKLDFMIVKYGMVQAEGAYASAGIPWATEAYVTPSQAELWGQKLANAVDAGAVAAVINAEVEWEREGPEPMERLIATFRARHPTVELYASVDTRGNRLSLPYQQVLRRYIAGWLPMVYPLSFYGSDSQGQRITPPTDFVARAFRDCLDGKDFGGIPVYPTIQTYDSIGARAVAEQIQEVKRRAHGGYQAYTIGHATDEEWAAFCPKEATMPTLEDLQAEIAELRAKVQADNTLQTQLIQAWAAFRFAPLSHVADKKPHIDSELLRKLDERYAQIGVK